ncbi:MAG TPA: hypothetical protein VGM84_24475 [Steroidobacteraceae bacterium]|jgi:hypothetical protein
MTKRIRNELTYAVPTSSGRWLQVAVSVQPDLSRTPLRHYIEQWKPVVATDASQPALRNPTRMH